jgi:hypothetical protein
MGCSAGGSGDVVVTQPTEPLQSTLTVDWTIDEAADPNLCSQSGSIVIEISVQDPNGNEVGAFQQACDAFATSITLDAGDYTAYAVMLDINGRPRTTHVAIAPFTLRGNDELHVPIDFPADSFR